MKILCIFFECGKSAPNLVSTTSLQTECTLMIGWRRDVIDVIFLMDNFQKKGSVVHLLNERSQEEVSIILFSSRECPLTLFLQCLFAFCIFSESKSCWKVGWMLKRG